MSLINDELALILELGSIIIPVIFTTYFISDMYHHLNEFTVHYGQANYGRKSSPAIYIQLTVAKIFFIIYFNHYFAFYQDRIREMIFGYMTLGFFYIVISYFCDLILLCSALPPDSRILNFYLKHHSLALIYITFVSYYGQMAINSSWYVIIWESHSIFPTFSLTLKTLDVQLLSETNQLILARICANLWCIIIYIMEYHENWSWFEFMITFVGCTGFNCFDSYMSLRNVLKQQKDCKTIKESKKYVGF